jgi:hypothetical protein
VQRYKFLKAIHNFSKETLFAKKLFPTAKIENISQLTASFVTAAVENHFKQF